MPTSRILRLLGASLPLTLTALLVASCSGGGGGNGNGGALQITAVNLPQNFSGWQLNRPIRISFSEPLLPSSVNTNTIHVSEPSGVPAFGTAGIDPSDPRTVIWRPTCPRLDDLSDAGLQPNTAYKLSIIGASQNAGFTIRAKSGAVLELSDTRSFTTPNSTLFSDLFVDDAVGPPVPVIRDAGSTVSEATYVLVAGVQHYFERQVGGTTVLNPPITLPLNLLSDPSSQVELYLQFNQSVDMRSSNINSTRLRWEFEEQPGVWTPITAAVSLESNCTEEGATVLMVPSGLLPPATNMRAVVAPEFRDIVSEQNLLVQDKFAPMGAVPAPAPLADNYLEEFADTLFDEASAPFAEPHAEWGTDGELQAKFSFQGSGGPGSDFDWKISSGEIVLLNSVNSTIQGGPNFVKQKTQTVIGGVIDVRNLWIESGGVLVCDGPNPITILASGSVRIEGLLDISGSNSPGVNTLDTTNIPEPGAPGRCGGGRGGTGSPLTTASSPRGGNGTGAFNVLDAGGQGGETGWSNGGGKDLRRGAGGGGGRLGENVIESMTGTNTQYVQTRIGMDGENGFDNLEASNGAINGVGPSRGGLLGPAPFIDSDPNNDFFGTKFDTVNNMLVVGELKRPWAGSGGGGGGDAARVPNGLTFPDPNFKPQGDEKGAGGGGGGGSLQVLALGQILFGANGQIVCRGGTGGGGENTIFLDRVGGGSGGGSGGHVILQSASVIDFTAKAGSTAIVATGGQGGAGKDDEGGAFRANSGIKETPPNKDSCPAGQTGCKNPVNGAGGDGSPGLVQLHTSGGLIGQDILLAPGETLASVCNPPPVCPLGAGTAAGSCYLVPTFGRLSRAQSKWVALGNGGFDAGIGQYKDVLFQFDGIDPVTGDVLREASGVEVAGLPALLTSNSVVAIGRSLVMDAMPLLGGPNEVYVRSPRLLRHFLVELSDSLVPTNFLRYDVVSATFDTNTNLLTLNFDPNGPAMEDFQSSGAVVAELQPAYFRVIADGVPDSIPGSTNVSILLSATTADAQGNPDLTYGVNMDEPLINWTSDIDDPMTGLNFPNNADLRFVRFQVLFDIDAMLQGLTPSNPIPALEFFRVGFRYQ